jgi:DNA-binding response OmpR family regulator
MDEFTLELFGDTHKVMASAFQTEQRPTMSSKRVMIVDHYDATVDLLAEIFKSEGYTPIGCRYECLNVASIADAQADLLILELGLGNPVDMLQLLRRLRQHPSTEMLPVIVNSTDEQLLAQLAEELRDLGCVGVAKPFDVDGLVTLVEAYLANGCEQGQWRPC